MVDPVSLIADPVVTTVLAIASDFIKEQYHLVYGVEEEVVRLKSNLTAIQASLADVNGILSDTSSQSLEDWLIKLKDSALDVQDMLEIYAAKASRMSRKKHRLVAKPLLRREAAKNIKKIDKRIAEIHRERVTFHFNKSLYGIREDVRPGTREAGPSPDTSQIFGRQDEKSNIITWLMSEESNIEGEVPVLPIIGMAGLGKTTLAQFIYNDETVKRHFKKRMIWVDVRREFVLERIGREMVEFATEMKLKVKAWSTVEKRIADILENKKFLLVLDDLWEVSFTDWGKLHQLLKKGKKSSRVLITSRTDELVPTLRARNPLFLDYLPEDESWSLFAKIAFEGGQPPTMEIERIAREIVQKCDRLPLAITAMAYNLACVDVSKWRNILTDGIWETEQQNARNGKPTILPALRLSYERLPSHLKQCFIYCHIFPKGHMFDKSELIKLWMAEGYLDSSGQSKLDQIGGDYFDVLRSRSFFQPLNIDNRKRYRIHDLFHDLAASVSGQFTFRFVDDSPCCVPENSRRVSFFCEHVKMHAPEVLKATKLRTILLPVNHSRNFGEEIDKIFCTLKYLRVLDLSSSTMTELPKSVGKLKLLRYLDLSHTEIRELPDSICKLINLQTLKLLGCLWIYKLPKGFNNLTNLWHLELDEMFWNKCTYLPPGIGALTNLQNLHFFRIGRDSMYRVEQLQSMKSLTGKLHISNLENTDTASAACLKGKECLEELVLEWSGGSINQDPGIHETVLQELEPHSNLKVLQIYYYEGSRLPPWMENASLENLAEISLISCVKILSLGSLPNIKKLCLKGMQNLEEWPDKQYLALRRLQISKCPKLKKLPSYFPDLEDMIIKKCDTLKDLPVAPSLKFLVLIDNAILENWNEELAGLEETIVEGGVEIPALPSYLSLLDLQIKNCQRLKGLPTVFLPQKLEISGCPLVQTLPDQVFGGLLQHLALDGCNDGTLVEAIPTTSETYSLVISNIAKLISLPVSINLSGLKALYINCCSDLESLSSDGAPFSSFTSLSLLSVCGCPKLTIFANNSLPSSLEYLIIKNCLSLKSLGPQNCLAGLNSLRDMQLEDCPEITRFPDGGLPLSLKHLCIERCPLLSQSFNDKSAYAQLQAQIADLEIDST